MIKNFIFDVDRTLIDSYGPEVETLKEALFFVTETVYSDEAMSDLTRLTTDDFFESLGIEAKSEQMEKIDYYWGVFLERKKLGFFDGMKDLLMDLKDNGFFLGIVTSRTEEELNELDELLGCMNLFSIVITSDKVSEPKPSPESLNVIIDKFHLKREETIYIGDGEVDSLAANKAHVHFGLAQWDNKEQIYPHDYLFQSPQDIYKLYQSVKRKKR